MDCSECGFDFLNDGVLGGCGELAANAVINMEKSAEHVGEGEVGDGVTYK